MKKLLNLVVPTLFATALMLASTNLLSSTYSYRPLRKYEREENLQKPIPKQLDTLFTVSKFFKNKKNSQKGNENEQNRNYNQ